MTLPREHSAVRYHRYSQSLQAGHSRAAPADHIDLVYRSVLQRLVQVAGGCAVASVCQHTDPGARNHRLRRLVPTFWESACSSTSGGGRTVDNWELNCDELVRDWCRPHAREPSSIRCPCRRSVGRPPEPPVDSSPAPPLLPCTQRRQRSQHDIDSLTPIPGISTLASVHANHYWTLLNI